MAVYPLRDTSTTVKWSAKQKSGWTSPLKITWIKEGANLRKKLEAVTNDKTSGKKRKQSFKYKTKGGASKTFTYNKAPEQPGRMAKGWRVVMNRKKDGFTVYNKMEYAKAVDLGHKHVPITFKSPAYFKGSSGGLVVMKRLKRGYTVKGKGIVKEALRRSVLSLRKPIKAAWGVKGQIARVNK